MDDIIQTLEEQQNSVAVENLDCKNKNKKELYQLAYMAIGEAMNYLEDIKKLQMHNTKLSHVLMCDLATVIERFNARNYDKLTISPHKAAGCFLPVNLLSVFDLR